MAHPVPADEVGRLAALRSLDILDTEPEDVYDDIVRIAAALTGAPMAIINFIDAERQWGKALVGLDDSEAPREASFCARTIVADDGVMVVPDTLADPAWAGNEMVVGDLGLRFYAGAAIVSDEGHALGSVCVADTEPREIDPLVLEGLQALARSASRHLELRRLSRELAAAKALWETGFEHASSGMSAATPDGKVIRVNARMAAISGYTQEELLEGGVRLLWDEDHRGDVAYNMTALWNGEVDHVEDEHLLRHADGSDVWVRVNASCIRDEAGRPLFLLAQFEDITAQKLAEVRLAATTDALREAEVISRRHAENLAAIAAVVRDVPAGKARTTITQAACDLSGAAMAMLIEPEGDDLVMTTSAGEPVAPFRLKPGEPSGARRSFETQEPLFVADAQTNARVSARVGKELGVRSALVQPVLVGGAAIAVLSVAWRDQVAGLSDHQAAVVGLLAAEAGVAIERDDLLVRLDQLARTDTLTGLSNRRVWDEQLRAELARAGRHGYPVTVAFFDIDHFKRLNDEQGHHAGDRLLVQAARNWRDALRDIDLIARWGGEEFVVALSGAQAYDALEVVERLRAATPAGATCSAGVAIWDGSEDAETLVRRADEAVYEAKRRGRDRSVLLEAQSSIRR